MQYTIYKSKIYKWYYICILQLHLNWCSISSWFDLVCDCSTIASPYLLPCSPPSTIVLYQTCSTMFLTSFSRAAELVRTSQTKPVKNYDQTFHPSFSPQNSQQWIGRFPTGPWLCEQHLVPRRMPWCLRGLGVWGGGSGGENLSWRWWRGLLRLWWGLDQIQGKMLPGVHSGFLSRGQWDFEAEHQAKSIWTYYIWRSGRHTGGWTEGAFLLHWEPLWAFLLPSHVSLTSWKVLKFVLTQLTCRSSWDSTLQTGPCHPAQTELEDCEVALRDGGLTCWQENLLALFASAPVGFRKCGRGKIYSAAREKCVKVF